MGRYLLAQSQQWKHQNNVNFFWKLTIKTPDVFIVKFDQIPHINLVFPLLTLSK